MKFNKPMIAVHEFIDSLFGSLTRLVSIIIDNHYPAGFQMRAEKMKTCDGGFINVDIYMYKGERFLLNLAALILKPAPVNNNIVKYR